MKKLSFKKQMLAAIALPAFLFIHAPVQASNSNNSWDATIGTVITWAGRALSAGIIGKRLYDTHFYKPKTIRVPIQEYAASQKLEPIKESTENVMREAIAETGYSQDTFALYQQNNYNTAEIFTPLPDPARKKRALGIIKWGTQYEESIRQHVPTHLQDMAIKQTIKHEIGHFHHNDNRYSRNHLKTASLITSHLAAHALWYLIPQPQDSWTSTHALSRGMAIYGTALIFDECLLNYYIRYQERRADAYAIQHAQSPTELQAQAYFWKAESVQEERELAQEPLWKRMLFPLARTHPSPFERAQTFSAAAEAMERRQSAAANITPRISILPQSVSVSIGDA